MVLLTGTNIVVDEFDYHRDKASGNYIYFLTHMHSGTPPSADHYRGLSNGWRHGPIYCSSLTCKLLMRRFPKLENVTALDTGHRYSLYLDANSSLKAEVTLFDANHIFGSVMYLFEG